MLTRLATFLHTHRRRVLYVAVVGAVIAGVFGAGVAKHLSPYGANDPATQSVQATNRFEAATGRQISPGVVALVDSGSVHSATAEQRIRQVASQLRSQPDVASVISYYDTRNAAMISLGGRSTYVLAYFKPLSDSRLKNDAQQIENHFAGQRDVKLGGAAIANAQVNTQVSHDLAHAELLAVPFIFLLSLLFFRSVVAALLPPLLGGLAIVATMFALRIVSGFADLSVFALNLTTGLGLGLAIDYSLFMVSRYREESAKSGFGVVALRRTLETAGRTILFSSLTVAVAIASLAIFPQRFLYSMGIAGALVALLAAALAVLVLPALLAALGPRVNALSPAWLARRADREARPAESGFWYRLSQFVMRRPGRVAIASAAVLIALGIPFTGIKFISVDASVLPTSASSRQVNDALVSQFPPNRTAALELVVGAPAGSSQVRALKVQLGRLPDVSAVAPAQPAGSGMSLVQVAPAQAPLSDATQQLVRNVRALHEPFYVGVAGETASHVDLEQSLGSHLPAVLAVVVASTLIVLFLMTGSVVLPIKAVLMNALNMSAVFGILVLIFQDGNLQGLLSSCSRSDSASPPTMASSCSRGSRRPAMREPRTPRQSRSGSSGRGGS
jgi:RND superfamily putative drug exporter